MFNYVKILTQGYWVWNTAFTNIFSILHACEEFFININHGSIHVFGSVEALFLLGFFLRTVED